MNAFTSLGTAVLLLSLGTIVPAFAQHEQESQARAETATRTRSTTSMLSHSNSSMRSSRTNRNSAAATMPNSKARTNKSAARAAAEPTKAQQQHAQQHNQQPSSSNQQTRTTTRTNSNSSRARQQNVQQPAHHTQEQQRVQQAAWQDHRSQNWQSDHRTWQQRGGYHGYRIPDNRYNGYFGPNHGFVIYSQPYMVVGGFPRFQYGGFWFSLVDPWPRSWSNNWYETDDVYVAYAKTDTTCTTRDTLASASQSAFRCKALRSAAVGRGLHFRGAARREGLSAKGKATLAVAHMSPGALEEKIW